MMRRYLASTAAFKRGTQTNIAGTLDPTTSFATLAGMDAVEVVVQHQSSQQAMKAIGRMSGETYMLDVDALLVPAGQDIKEQDRVVIASGDHAGTFTIIEARKIQGRVWNCMMERVQNP